MDTFQTELTALINKYSLENGSNTPDFILASFLQNCLCALDEAVQEREASYGRDPDARPYTAVGEE